MITLKSCSTSFSFPSKTEGRTLLTKSLETSISLTTPPTTSTASVCWTQHHIVWPNKCCCANSATTFRLELWLLKPWRTKHFIDFISKKLNKRDTTSKQIFRYVTKSKVNNITFAYFFYIQYLYFLYIYIFFLFVINQRLRKFFNFF